MKMSEFCFISKTVPLSSCTQQSLKENELQENEPCTDSTFGGVLSNSKYAWYANGPRFQVVDLKRGRTIAGWCFGSAVKDFSTKVVCVAEIPALSRDLPVLVVALGYALTGGTICIFDVLSSKVLRAIELREKISSIHVIDGGTNLLPLYGPLRSFDGVVGVGCIGGDVLLLDLCQHSITEEENRDETEACQVIQLTSKDLPNLEYHKQSLQPGIHLAINLNGCNQMPSHRNSPDVSITSLCYCPQLGSLLVGYSFGSWQIWELLGMTLVYSSPMYDKNMPVSHFGFQEPADDPKPVCYIWAVYSYAEACPGHPLAVLYSINYATKEFHDGYGILYQNFEVCIIRYQMELASPSRITPLPSREANCLRITSYNKSNSSKNSLVEHQEDIFSICCLVWNVNGPKGVETYLSLFDLNQWYKAHMPSHGTVDCDNYLLVICITDLIGNEDFLLDVAMDESSLKQFLGVQKPEEHYFPTALSFDICCCEKNTTYFIHHQGKQKSLLNSLEKDESLIFLKPLELCQTALELGLSPLFFDASINSITSQREFLLSLALEQQMTGWLYKCANTWSNGRFKSSGCTLGFFLEWAWNRATVLKANADALTTPFFDYSESMIDANNQRIFNFCINQLANLHMIYEYIIKKLNQFILYKDIICKQCASLQMVIAHLNVVQWLVNTGLLPETGKSHLYPIDALLCYYGKRRLEIQDAYKQRFSFKENLLFIDNLLEKEFASTSLQEYWREDDGNGLYPPLSMQSLLRVYLMDEVDLNVKHSVIIYAFLDLAMALDRDKDSFIVTQLIKFPVIFQLNPRITRLTQAFWHLDHGDFGPALERLLDPLILNGDLKNWHHQTVINACLVQGQHNLALTYYQIRNPFLKDDKDVLKILSVFTENNMIHEAIEFQRKHVSAENQVETLMHLYKECDSTKQLKKILHCTLTEKEEQVLIKYLHDVAHPHQEELEVRYYLERFRYMDIFQMSKRQAASPAPSGLSGQKLIPFKETFAKALSGFFPKVSMDLFNICQKQTNVQEHKVISRPRPMSVVIHNTEEQARYKSTLIQISIEKAKETWKKPVVEEPIGTKVTAENFPFVRTPVTPASNARKRPSLVFPKIIKVNGDPEETSGESSSKKQKLSPKYTGSLTSRKSLNTSLNISSFKITNLDTPVIKRKSTAEQISQRDTNLTMSTPQSILKASNFITSNVGIQQDNSSNLLNNSNSTLSPGLGITPRKSLSRLSVHFEKNSNILSSTENSEHSILKTSSASAVCDASTRKSQDSKDTSEETYYSPESSLENIDVKDTSDTDKLKETVMEKETVKVMEETKSLSSNKSNLQIKCRSSYKAPEKPIEVPITTPKPTKVASIQSSPDVSSLSRAGGPKSRKSLARMVLENNALSTLLSPTRRSARLSSSLSKRLSLTPKEQKIIKTPEKVDSEEEGSTNKTTVEPTIGKEESSSSELVISPNISKLRLRGRRSLTRTADHNKNSPNVSTLTNITDQSIAISEISSLTDQSSYNYLDMSIFNTDTSGMLEDTSRKVGSCAEEAEKQFKTSQKIAKEVLASEPATSETTVDSKSVTKSNLSLPEPQSIEKSVSITQISSDNKTDKKEDNCQTVAMREEDSFSSLRSDFEKEMETSYDYSFPESLFHSSSNDLSVDYKISQQNMSITSDTGQGNKEEVSKVEEHAPNIETFSQEADQTNAKAIEQSLVETEENVDEISSEKVFQECESVEVPKINFEETATNVSLNEFEMNIECSQENIDEVSSEKVFESVEEPKINFEETATNVSLNEFEMNIDCSESMHTATESLLQSSPPDTEILQREEKELGKVDCSIPNDSDLSKVLNKGFISSPVIEITDSSEESISSKEEENVCEPANGSRITAESDQINKKSTELISQEIHNSSSSYSSEGRLDESDRDNFEVEIDVLELSETEDIEVQGEIRGDIKESQTAELSQVQEMESMADDVHQLKESVEEATETKNAEIQVTLLAEEPSKVQDDFPMEEEDIKQETPATAFVENECERISVYQELENLQFLENKMSPQVDTQTDVDIIEYRRDAVVDYLPSEQPNEQTCNKSPAFFELDKEEVKEECETKEVLDELVEDNQHVEMLDQIATEVKQDTFLSKPSEVKIEETPTRSPEEKQNYTLDICEQTPPVPGRKILRPVVYDILESWSPYKPIANLEEIKNKGVSRTTRSSSADPETPRRKSRRLSGAEIVDSPAVTTRRVSLKSTIDENVQTSKPKMLQSRMTRSSSMSDFESDNLQETKQTGRRTRRTNSAAMLPAISEERDNEKLKNVKGRKKTQKLEGEETIKDDNNLKIIDEEEQKKETTTKKMTKSQTSKSTGVKSKLSEKIEQKQDEDKEEREMSDNVQTSSNDYQTSRRLTRTQKTILAKVQSVQSLTAEELNIEYTASNTFDEASKVAKPSSRIMTRTRSFDSIASTSSQLDTGRITRSGLKKKGSEESLTSLDTDVSKASSVERSSTARKRTRNLTQKSDTDTEVELEPSQMAVRRSTRSRSKTPEVQESCPRTTRKLVMERIPEEQEKPQDEPIKKKGRPRK